MNQHAFGLNIALSMGWVFNRCGQDKLHLVNMFTMASVHLSTLVNPQSALMCYLGKKCTKVGGILQESSSLGVEQWLSLTDNQ
jgi:hypothetical protein